MRVLTKNLMVILLTLSAMALSSCRNDDIPKPRGFFRIDLPEHAYRPFDSAGYPYRFEYPVYASIQPKQDSAARPYWIDVNFPKLRGSCYLSYMPVQNNIKTYLEDSRTLVMKHMPKSDGIEEILIQRPEERVFGTLYLISGTNSASACQFYLTDSLHHFIRGALYFNTIPNNDSLEPVLDFVIEDIHHLIGSFRWKNPGKPTI